MDDVKFDRLARAFAKTLDRRRMVALMSGATGLLGQQAARGAQLGPATCGEQGAVCTLISGCCDGLTCVTSAINTSYGICVPGEGGMVSTGTTLISPFSETAVEDVGALLDTAPTAPTTDPPAERQTRPAETGTDTDTTETGTDTGTGRSERKTRSQTSRTERKARSQTSRTQRKARLDRKRATARDRKEDKRNRKREAREDDDVALDPQLRLKLMFSEADGNSDLPGNQPVPIEMVRVTNLDDVSVVLTRIETIKGDADSADLTTPQFTLKPGESYSFVSGLPPVDIADATEDEYRWLSDVACDETVQRQGYRVTAAFSRDEEHHEFVVYCARGQVTAAIETPAATPRREPKKNGEQQHTRNGQRQKTKKR